MKRLAAQYAVKKFYTTLVEWRCAVTCLLEGSEARCEMRNPSTPQ